MDEPDAWNRRKKKRYHGWYKQLEIECVWVWILVNQKLLCLPVEEVAFDVAAAVWTGCDVAGQGNLCAATRAGHLLVFSIKLLFLIPVFAGDLVMSNMSGLSEQNRAVRKKSSYKTFPLFLSR